MNRVWDIAEDVLAETLERVALGDLSASEAMVELLSTAELVDVLGEDDEW